MYVRSTNAVCLPLYSTCSFLKYLSREFSLHIWIRQTLIRSVVVERNKEFLCSTNVCFLCCYLVIYLTTHSSSRSESNRIELKARVHGLWLGFLQTSLSLHPCHLRHATSLKLYGFCDYMPQNVWMSSNIFQHSAFECAFDWIVTMWLLLLFGRLTFGSEIVITTNQHIEEWTTPIFLME